MLPDSLSVSSQNSYSLPNFWTFVGVPSPLRDSTPGLSERHSNNSQGGGGLGGLHRVWCVEPGAIFKMTSLLFHAYTTAHILTFTQ